jgi:hypothetical protein
MELPTITILAPPDVAEKVHPNTRAVWYESKNISTLIGFAGTVSKATEANRVQLRFVLPTCWRAWNLTLLFPSIKTTNPENAIPREGYRRWL